MPTYLGLLLIAAFSPPLAFAAEKEANGVFLVAGRAMGDPRFRETVVLVTQPRVGGPWGVIVNKPLAHRLADVIADHASLKTSKDVLYFGGPVAPQGLVFLVREAQPPPRSLPVLKDVYFTSDAAWIDERLGRHDPTRGLRVYAGYSGWVEGQLQNEMRRGDWHVLPADAETVFDKDPARIWPELIERATAKQAHWGGETENVNRETKGGTGSGISIHDGRPPVARLLAGAGL